MSRYDGLIIPRSYSEYINKTDAATLQQALQLSGVLSGAVAAGDNKAVTSDAVYEALTDWRNRINITNANLAIPEQNTNGSYVILSNGSNLPTENNYIINSFRYGGAGETIRGNQIAYRIGDEGVTNDIWSRVFIKGVNENNYTFGSWEQIITDGIFEYKKANKVYNYKSSSDVYIYLFTGSDSWEANSIDYIKVLEKRLNFAPSLIEFSYTNNKNSHFRYNFNEILTRDNIYGNRIIITNNYKVYLKVVSYSAGRIETNRVLQMENYTALPTGETEEYIL